MEGGLLLKTYFFAGRTTRIYQDTALAIVRGPARVAAWTNERVVSSARLLNPFNWRKKAVRRWSRKSSPAVRTVRGARATKAPSDTIPEAPVPRAPKTDRRYPDALRRLGAEVRAMDPASEVDMIKVVAKLETMLHELADTAPSVSRTLKTALKGLMDLSRGGIADTGGAVSDIARALETGGRRLAAPKDTGARDARPPDAGGYAAPPEVTLGGASAAVHISARERLILSRAVEDMGRRDEAVRARAARALGGIRHELSASALSARLARDPSAEVRKECVNALAALGMKEGLPALESALSDTSPGVRLAAVRAVYRLGGAESAASLVRMLSDEHEDVRRRAAACVGWLGQGHLAAELAPLLKDGSAFVRRTALDAMGNLKSSPAVAAVIELLDDPEESVQRKAFEVLGTITGKQMTETFPEDEHGRQLLIARWRMWQEERPWRGGSLSG